MLPCVAVCCSVLRRVAVFGSVCSMLQCSVLQHVAVFDGVQGLESMVQGLGFRQGLG